MSTFLMLFAIYVPIVCANRNELTGLPALEELFLKTLTEKQQIGTSLHGDSKTETMKSFRGANQFKDRLIIQAAFRSFLHTLYPSKNEFESTSLLNILKNARQNAERNIGRNPFEKEKDLVKIAETKKNEKIGESLQRSDRNYYGWMDFGKRSIDHDDYMFE